MENASKALIIAGAILLAILIITLGLIGYRQAAGVMDNNAMDEVAITTFNQKFIQYEGARVSGTQVNALLDVMVQNNVANSGDSSKQVKLNCGTMNGNNWHAGPGTSVNAPLYRHSDTDPQHRTGNAYANQKYKVEMIKDEKTGLVTEVKISPAS